MKRILALVLCCIMVMSFSSCAIVPFSMKVRCEVEEITSIEFYYFDEPVYVGYTTDGLVYHNWDEDGNYYEVPYTGEPIAYVEEADYEQFVADVEDLPFRFIIVIAAVDPSWEYTDYVVKINWEGDYQLIAQTGGGLVGYCEEEAWQDFLKKYIGEEHFNNSQENSQS